MKKSLVVLLLILAASTVNAQKEKEVGLMFSSLDNYGLVYKVGTQKGLLRFSLLSASLSHSNVNSSESNWEVGTSIGYEYRKLIARDLKS